MIDSNFLLINKESGWTSHDVVKYIKKILRQKKLADKKTKIGHAGTLDPFATGLLIVGIGKESTKRLDEFKNMKKTYIATIMLGAVSDTFDSTGKIIDTIHDTNNKTQKQFNSHFPNSVVIEQLLKNFIGKQLQIPPMFSAKKINGKKLYELAREGKIIERKPSEIEIYNIKILVYNWPILKIEVICSIGTYIRSLANDIGEKLGVGAYCKELERTKIGEYSLNQAIDVKTL